MMKLIKLIILRIIVDINWNLCKVMNALFTYVFTTAVQVNNVDFHSTL